WRIFPYKGIAPIAPYMQLAILSGIIWTAMLHANRIYRGKKFINPCFEFSQIIQSSFYSGVIISAITFFYRGFSYSRIAVILGLFIGFTLVSIIHLLLNKFSTYDDTQFFLIGDEHVLQSIVKRLLLHRVPERSIVFCKAEELENLLIREKTEPGGVYVIVCLDDMRKIQEISDICNRHNMHLFIYPKDIRVFLSGGSIEEIYGIPFITSHILPLDSWHNRLLKRFFDIIFSMMFLTMGMPILIITAVLIKFSSPGPVFFVQERVGYKNKKFLMIKFRTMMYGSEDILPYTRTDDTRITRIGRFLRACNIDEIPQFFNVLKSDMSIVGPRPVSVKDRIFFTTPGFNERMRILPGITGWAQIHGLKGGQIEPEERFRYDLYYEDNWSIWLDFAIMVFTIIPFTGKIKSERLDI
ncbi:MAG TPA: exopolysaccharide biosynthesis polyprenyl glycosylphosphotransferase, partial [bacterium]|nr:exopolysaccharide biosynthesis polyprenyl glycosylphosphotransferase [bacterium]